MTGVSPAGRFLEANTDLEDYIHVFPFQQSFVHGNIHRARLARLRSGDRGLACSHLFPVMEQSVMKSHLGKVVGGVTVLEEQLHLPFDSAQGPISERSRTTGDFNVLVNLLDLEQFRRNPPV